VHAVFDAALSHHTVVVINIFSPSCEEMGPREDRIRMLEHQLAAETAKRVIAETKLAKAQAQKAQRQRDGTRTNPLDVHMKNGGEVKTVRKTMYRNKKKETEVDKAKRKIARKRTDAKLSAWRKANNLFVKDGTVKPTKLLLLDNVTAEFAKDAMFQEDRVCIRDGPPQLVKQLAKYIGQVREILMTPEGRLLEQRRVNGETFSREEVENSEDFDLAWHKFGGNRGVNLGISCVSGGVHANTEEGWSGSVHYGKFAVKHWYLCKKILKLINKILDHSYGKVHWYKQAKAYCAQLNAQSKEERTVAGTVFSGVWLTLETRENSTHRDKNVVGPTFLCSTYTPTEEKNGALLIQPTATEKKAILVPLPPGRIVGGSWAQDYHNNQKVDAHAKRYRTSLVLYLDYRIFGRNYKFVQHNGVGFLNG
jgi:hypothetical protein